MCCRNVYEATLQHSATTVPATLCGCCVAPRISTPSVEGFTLDGDEPNRDRLWLTVVVAFMFNNNNNNNRVHRTFLGT